MATAKKSTAKAASTVTIGPAKKGQKAVTFSKGGLHRSVGVPKGEKIPATKMAAAKAGHYGPKAKRQAVMATGMLAAGRKTAAHGAKPSTRKQGAQAMEKKPVKPMPKPKKPKK